MRALSRQKYVRLSGGLGNNLFQLAFAFHLARAYELAVEVFRISNRNFTGNSTLSWNFQRNDEEAKSLFESFGFLKGYFSKSCKNRFQEAFFTPGSRVRNIVTLRSLRNCPFNNDSCWYPSDWQSINYDIFSGYFQNANLVLNLQKDFFDSLLNAIEEKSDDEYVSMSKEFEACIQVRRGDYRFHKETIGLLKDQFFLEAIESLGFNPSIAEILIVTDEPEACQNLSKLLPRSRIVGPLEVTPVTAIMMLAASKRLVISNSSLAWWGGLLARKFGEAKVIAPDRWKIEVCAQHGSTVLSNGVGFDLKESRFDY